MKLQHFGSFILPVVTPLLFFESVQAHNSRELKLECPADGFNDVSNENYEGRYDRYSKGDLGRHLVERLRKKPESYYQNIVDNAIMLLCDVETASIRCVDEDSPYAAKDWSGEHCIKALDHECPSGTCERSSNCYWNTVEEGKNRTTRFEMDAYKNAKSSLYDYGMNNKSYVKEIAQVGIIGAAISVLLLIFWVIFFIGRYLCCCLWIPCSGFCFLCSPIPKKDGYHTFRDVFIPISLYIVSCAGIMTAGSMAFVGNEDISVGLSNTFLHADGLAEDLRLFLGRSRIPLENIGLIVDDAAIDAKSLFDGTDYVKNDALQIVSSFLGFYRLHSDGLNASGAVQTFDASAMGFDEKVTPITDNVQSMLDTLELDLYGKVDTIKGGIKYALEGLTSFAVVAEEWQNALYKYEGKELGIRNIRRAGVMTMFLLSCFFGAMGFMGIIISKRRTRMGSFFSHMIKVTGFFSSWLGSLSLGVASVLLCTSFVVYDACQISEIVTRDFEPFVGDKVSPGANACFNRTQRLDEAFNVTEKVNFQAKLDEGLQLIETVNVTEKFQLVLEPLFDIQTLIGSISDSALSALNQATAQPNNDLCPFTDMYTKETLLRPWSLDRLTEDTTYVIRENRGSPTSYSRMGSEDGETYLERIYNKAGVCSAPSSCCIQYTMSPSATCLSNIYSDCDYGDNCVYACDILKNGIIEGYKAFFQLHNIEMAMTADLGVSCPTDKVDFDDTCPTQEFQSRYANLTLVGLLEDYKGKITETKDTLVNLASTSVGATMLEVEDFLCNMNVSFVERRYDEVNHDICVTFFGGVTQINWAFWMVGVSLEAVAIVAHILSVRLRGLSQKDVERRQQTDCASRADVYG